VCVSSRHGSGDGDTLEVVTDRESRRLSFGSVAADYDRYRPAPPPQAFDWLIPPDATAVLDLAAGTGAVTRLLIGRAARVVAVESGQRRTAFERDQPFLDGVLEKTGKTSAILQRQTVDFKE